MMNVAELPAIQSHWSYVVLRATHEDPPGPCCIFQDTQPETDVADFFVWGDSP